MKATQRTHGDSTQPEVVSNIFASDLHVNSTVALFPPRVTLDDGGSRDPSPYQRDLWGWWKEFCQDAARLPGRRILHLVGDIGELDTKKRSVQLVTLNKADTIKLVLTVLEPILSVVDGVMVYRGTPAHTGKSAWLEETIASDLDHAIRPSEGAASWWHARPVSAGVRLDVSHHAGMGKKPWAKRGAAVAKAGEMTWEYMVDMQQPPPHVAIRAHNHTFADSGDNYPVRLFYLGAWTFGTEYMYRGGWENATAEIGGYFITCQDGKYTHQRMQYRKRQRVWTLTI
jgi:hypothetical protein